MPEKNNFINLKEYFYKACKFILLKSSHIYNTFDTTKRKLFNNIKKFFIQKKDKHARRIDLKKQQYNSLAPRNDIKDSATVDMLEKALIEKSNKNVALSGKYGAGKSSIVLSTLKKQRKLKPLYISLGMLGIKDKDIEDEDAEIISRTIEKSIIQQIIYKEKSNKFPASRIKRIPYVNKSLIFFITLVIAFYKLEIV